MGIRVTGIALHFYLEMVFMLHSKQMRGPARPVTGMALLFICR
jgi:hypothetical protein